MDDNAVKNLLVESRRGLPATSKTAAAIDRGASLEEISECATEEGLHQLAAALFGAEQELDNPHYELATDPLAGVLAGFRGHIAERSKTAKAIARGATIAEIAECAEADGIHDLATALFGLQQEATKE